MGAERHFVSDSEEATEALAAQVGSACPAGTVLALGGDLGTGKTCFVRGLARGLGIDGTISSPTYTLMQAHEGGRLPLFHFDAWMEGREKAWLAEGGEAWLRGEGVAAIEWAGRVADWLPSPRIEIHLSHLAPDQRGLDFVIVGPEGKLRQALEGLLGALKAQAGVREGDGAAPGRPNNGTSA